MMTFKTNYEEHIQEKENENETCRLITKSIIDWFCCDELQCGQRLAGVVTLNYDDFETYKEMFFTSLNINNDKMEKKLIELKSIMKQFNIEHINFFPTYTFPLPRYNTPMCDFQGMYVRFIKEDDKYYFEKHIDFFLDDIYLGYCEE